MDLRIMVSIESRVTGAVAVESRRFTDASCTRDTYSASEGVSRTVAIDKCRRGAVDSALLR